MLGGDGGSAQRGLTGGWAEGGYRLEVCFILFGTGGDKVYRGCGGPKEAFEEASEAPERQGTRGGRKGAIVRCAAASLEHVEVDPASELDGGLVGVVLEERGPVLHLDEAGGEAEGRLLGEVEEFEVLVEELGPVGREGDEHLARARGEQAAAGVEELAVLAVVEDHVAEDDDVEGGALARRVLAERGLDVRGVVAPDVPEGGAVGADLVFGDVLADVADQVCVRVVCGHHEPGAQVRRENRREGSAGAHLEHRLVAHQRVCVFLQVPGQVEARVRQDVAVQRRRPDEVDLQPRVCGLREVLGERALGLLRTEALRFCKQRRRQHALCHRGIFCSGVLCSGVLVLLPSPRCPVPSSGPPVAPFSPLRLSIASCPLVRHRLLASLLKSSEDEKKKKAKSEKRKKKPAPRPAYVSRLCQQDLDFFSLSLLPFFSFSLLLFPFPFPFPPPPPAHRPCRSAGWPAGRALCCPRVPKWQLSRSGPSPRFLSPRPLAGCWLGRCSAAPSPGGFPFPLTDPVRRSVLLVLRP